MKYKSKLINSLIVYCAIVTMVLVFNIRVNTASAVPSPPILLYDSGSIEIQTINGQNISVVPTVQPGSTVTVTGVARGGESQSQDHCTIWGDPVNEKFDIGFDYSNRYALPLRATSFVRDTGEASISTNLQQTQFGMNSLPQCPIWSDVFRPYEYTFEYSFDTTGLPSGLHTTTITNVGVLAPANGPPGDVLTSSAQYIVSGSILSCSVTPITHTVDPGSNYSYDINTTVQNGFNNPVTFTSSISPVTANPPVISFTNNGQSAPATTEANITTSGGPSQTTAGTYTLTFTGTGGGETSQCNTQLIVNPTGPNFELQVTPGLEGVGIPSPQTTPNRILVGQTKTFTVVAVCTGGFTGPVTQLEAVSEFTGVTMSFSPPGSPPNGATVNCGSSIILTANNSSTVTQQDLSSPSSLSGVVLKNIVVRGRGQIN